ncbi:alpha-ketoglutarate-dependent taurine dioxygenase [Bradyrhizobium sp. LB7.1]
MSHTTSIDSVIPRADIVKRAARLGAEIRNIKLSGDLSRDAIRAIRSGPARAQGDFLPQPGAS